MVGNRNQRGFTLIELSVTVFIVLIFATLAMKAWTRYTISQTLTQVAAQTRAVSIQMARYVQANNDTLLAGSLPTRITTSTIAAAGYPISTGPNDYGQSYVLALYKDGAGALKAMNVSTGGNPIIGKGVRDVARSITQLGGVGGYIDTAITSNDPGVAYVGTSIGTKESLSSYGFNPGAGHVADLLFLSSQMQQPGLADTALQRFNTPGRPELNQMGTDIDMGSHSIRNATTVNASFLGAKGMDGASGYPTGWGGGVHTLDVYAEGTIGAGTGGTLMASLNRNGDITGQNLSIVNATATGEFITSGDGGLRFGKWGGGLWMGDTQWVRILGDKGLLTAGQINAGSIVSNGRATFNEFLQLNRKVVINTSCSPANLMAAASDNSGAVYCKNGVWTPMQGLNDSVQVVSSSSSCEPSGAQVVAACPASYRLTGGGFVNTRLSGSNAPMTSRPNGNGWLVQAGTTAGSSCWASYAVCGR